MQHTVNVEHIYINVTYNYINRLFFPHFIRLLINGHGYISISGDLFVITVLVVNKS